MDERIRAFKAFDGDLSCRGFVYEVGKTYKHGGAIALCESGFHACRNPLDCWNYYPPTNDRRYAEVELSGVVKADEDKVVASEITIIRELTLSEMIDLAVAISGKGAAGRESASSGYDSQSASSGDYSKSASSGDYSKSASSGYGSKSEATGKNTIAMVAGVKGKARAGENGCFALCYYDDASKRNRIAVGYVGEDEIKADTWYEWRDGGLREVKDD